MNALIVVEPTHGLDGLVGRLRSMGVSPIVGLSLDQATRLLATFRPDLAIVGHAAGSPQLVRRLERRGVPVVLVDGSEDLGRTAELRMIVAALLSPVKPDLAPSLVDLTEDGDAAEGADVLEVGPVRLDRVARVAFVDEERVDIPPMELAILEELAMRPGEPIPAEALRRRLWPEDAPATSDDVHRHVYRLRRLIGDQERLRPLITNRRGFGYVLDVLEPVGSTARSPGPEMPNRREAASGA
ncbi:MAG TPA: winged helix-turn-helix domain-containing protein [Actinomycetota bacterium]|nr:winged helix-turn-helix domain-containing protein [Actinomycetota bacterium]